jgi:hypothetical protein
MWDDSRKSEIPFLLFDSNEFSSVAGPCRQNGQAEQRDSEYKGPLGSSNTARVIRYSGGLCADAGLTREIFIPYLGMVQRAETSLVGERTLDLVYAQIGGMTYLNEAGVSFSISLTALPDQIAVKLILQNRTDRELDLQFNSSQTYDLILRNEKGETVYRWSADKIFLQAQRQLSVKVEEVWQEVLPAKALSPGNYSIEGLLVNSDGRKFAATATVKLP